MKKHILMMITVIGIFNITGCSKEGWEEQTTAEAKVGVDIYKGDMGFTYNLSILPYDMEYNKNIIQFSSCELYQEKSDASYSYTPYIVAKVKIDGIDNETLCWFDKELYTYGNISNDKNQLNGKELSKVCEIDNGGYRYYVFSKSLLTSDDYKYDFSESVFNINFSISQDEKVTYEVSGKQHTDNKFLKYNYHGNSSHDVKDLKALGEDIWYEIKQKQLELMKHKI